MSPFSLIDISLPIIVFFTAPSIPSQHLTMLIVVLLLMSFMSQAMSWSHTFSLRINFRFLNNFKLRSLVLFLSALKGAVKRLIQCLITFCPPQMQIMTILKTIKNNVLSGISQSDLCNHGLKEIWTSQGACCPSRLESVPVSGAAVTAPIISRNK